MNPYASFFAVYLAAPAITGLVALILLRVARSRGPESRAGEFGATFAWGSLLTAALLVTLMLPLDLMLPYAIATGLAAFAATVLTRGPHFYRAYWTERARIARRDAHVARVVTAYPELTTLREAHPRVATHLTALGR